MSDTCRSCGAPITWVITEKGHRMPLDRDPHPEGNIVPATVTGPYDLVEVRARVLSGDELHGATAWRSHFVTCPNSARHRKGKR